ncbi:MAG: ComEA family DNA-binding protein [Tissierellia bacterium]|nr:ComEA family DNA-binding protein [Tissierellia bacterium]
MPLSTREKKLFVGFFCVLALIFFWIKDTGTQNRASGLLEPIETEIGEVERISQEESKEAVVHISGGVHRPGLYTCSTETRVADVVEMAGGFLPEADQSTINLAKKVRDEEKIHIFLIGESPMPVHMEMEGTGLLININTADHKTLQDLPGIGEKTADKIIQYREQIPFGAIEDIKNVPGIGEKKFEEIKELITY